MGLEGVVELGVGLQGRLIMIGYFVGRLGGRILEAVAAWLAWGGLVV